MAGYIQDLTFMGEKRMLSGAYKNLSQQVTDERFIVDCMHFVMLKFYAVNLCSISLTILEKMKTIGAVILS